MDSPGVLLFLSVIALVGFVCLDRNDPQREWHG